MKKGMNKFFGVILTFLMIASIVPTTAFALTEDFYTYELTDGKATITYADEALSGEIVIPAFLGGCPVTEIGSYAFSDCENITGVILPESLLCIGTAAFKGTDIKELIIPANVCELGVYLFDEGKLEKYTVVAENPYFSSDEYGVLYSKDKTVLVSFPVLFPYKSYTIPDGVETIGTAAFYSQCTLNELIMADSLKSIEDEAFFGCYALETVQLSENLETIGACNFYFCFYIKELSLPASLKYVGAESFIELYSLQKIKIYSKDVDLSETYLGCLFLGETVEDHKTLADIYYRHFYTLYRLDDYETATKIAEEVYNYESDSDPFLNSYPVYCYKNSTAEEYAIANNMEYIYMCEQHTPEKIAEIKATCLTTGLSEGYMCSVCGEILVSPEETAATGHIFGQWENDYENLIATRKCTACDEVETKVLENQGTGDVEIIAPSNPDLDFDIGSIDEDSETYLLVEQTIQENTSVKAEVLKVFDITLKNLDGVHVQPDGTVKVKLPIGNIKNDNFKVYRVNDDGTLTDMNAYREGSHMVFDTDHFSIYVIVEEEPDNTTDGSNDILTLLSEFIKKIMAFINIISDFLKSLPISVSI